MFIQRQQDPHMTRPALARLVSLAATVGPFAALACGDPAGPGAPSSYDVTVTPRGPSGAPGRFTGTNAGYGVVRTPTNPTQTTWAALMTIRLMKKSGDAPVAVFVVLFPDTTVRLGRFEIWHPRTGPRPAGAVATGHVIPPDGVGIREIESGQLELAAGPSGVVEGSFTAQVLRVPIGGIVEVEADAAGQFVARRLTSPGQCPTSQCSVSMVSGWTEGPSPSIAP